MRECDYCGLVSGRSVDTSTVFTTFYGELGTAPMIEECPIDCECRLTGPKVDFAMDSVFFGEVVASYVDAALYKKGRKADILAIDPLLTGIDRRYRRVGEAVGKAFSIGREYAPESERRVPGKARG
jgi:flavin reductase (DIM6/NTAB) family NADH-FMN oxidoreductase RutF